MPCSSQARGRHLAHADQPSPDLWTRFGADQPNVFSGGIVYNAADNVLVNTTYGRGEFEVGGRQRGRVYRQRLEICGDTDTVNENDTFKLELATAPIRRCSTCCVNDRAPRPRTASRSHSVNKIGSDLRRRRQQHPDRQQFQRADRRATRASTGTRRMPARHAGRRGRCFNQTILTQTAGATRPRAGERRL